MCVPVCFQVDAADTKVVPGACEPWQVVKGLPVGVYGLGTREVITC